MNITPEIVKNLLNTLVTPDFENDIVGYNVILRQNPEGKIGIGIDVLMPASKEYTTISRDKSSIERSVRNVMKYLSPTFVMVEFYNVTDY